MFCDKIRSIVSSKSRNWVKRADASYENELHSMSVAGISLTLLLLSNDRLHFERKVRWGIFSNSFGVTPALGGEPLVVVSILPRPPRTRPLPGYLPSSRTCQSGYDLALRSSCPSVDSTNNIIHRGILQKEL